MNNKIQLQTTINVSHADTSNLVQGGVTSGIVTMEIGQRNLIIPVDGEPIVEVAYVYLDSNGNKLPTTSNVMTINSNVTGLSSALPLTGNDIVDIFSKQISKFAKQQMILTFNELTEENQITEV